MEGFKELVSRVWKRSELDKKDLLSIELRICNFSVYSTKGALSQSYLDLLIKLEKDKMQILKVSFGNATWRTELHG